MMFKLLDGITRGLIVFWICNTSVAAFSAPIEPSSQRKLIGKGGYGKVFDLGDGYALKSQSCRSLPVVAQRICSEVTILNQLGLAPHPHLLYGSGCSMDGDNICVRFPHMPGDLNRVNLSTQDLTSDHIQYFLFQMMSGLTYLHAADIIHTDATLANALTTERCEVRVCDFGLAHHRELAQEHKPSEELCTRWYRAPELNTHSYDLRSDTMARHPSGEVQPFTSAVDVFSVGVSLADLLLRRDFFTAESEVELAQMHAYWDHFSKTGNHEPSFSRFISGDPAKVSRWSKFKSAAEDLVIKARKAEAFALLTKLLILNPSTRPSMAQAMEDSFISNRHSPVRFSRENAKTLGQNFLEYQRGLKAEPVTSAKRWHARCQEFVREFPVVSSGLSESKQHCDDEAHAPPAELPDETSPPT